MKPFTPPSKDGQGSTAHIGIHRRVYPGTAHNDLCPSCVAVFCQADGSLTRDLKGRRLLVHPRAVPGTAEILASACGPNT